MRNRSGPDRRDKATGGGPASLLVALAASLFALTPASAQSEVPAAQDLPEDLAIEFGHLSQTDGGESVFTGDVAITWRESRIQAERISLRDGRHIAAEGDVLVVWEGNRVFGSRMTYDLETERGVIEDAYGQVENDYLFWARRAEKIGPQTLRLEGATVTTCTQPVPYWSFSVSSATIRIDGYARMWNVRLRARRLPLIWLPYIVWPVKKNRAAGLLMPEFHTTRDRGRAVTQELFVPLGRSADLTLRGRYYTEAGFGGGGEVRVVPNRHGEALFDGFYINDEVEGRGRYRSAYRQTQEFRNGFRMIADINLVSDFDYFQDFERELNLVSSPTILARVELARNGPWTSLNVRELRREQLFSDGTSLIQQTLPEVELRGRSRRLGPTPLYLAYEASIASIQQRRQSDVPADRLQDADYFRADVSPTLSVPLSPWPWLEITPRASLRLTHWTQSLEKDASGSRVSGHSLTRDLWTAGLELAGPRFFRIFRRPSSPFSTQYKHTIEPRVVYGYGEDFERTDEVILYDEVDRIAGSGNQLAYSLVQRLFAQRPRAEPVRERAAEEVIVLPDGSTSDPAEERAETAAEADVPEAERPREPVEIASFELRQSHSFDRDLSTADLDRDGVNEDGSRFSSVQVVGRYNPGPATSFDLRGTYDILYERIGTVSASGSVRGQRAQARFSLVHRNGLAVNQVDDTQVQFTTGLSLLRGKLRIDLRGAFDADPSPGQDRFPDKRWRVQYQTQCCKFLVERLARNYANEVDRQDFYFRVDLTGVGKLLDFKY